MKFNTYHLLDTPLVTEIFQLHNKIKEHVPNVYLAGGALRDLVYGKIIRDFDFYFNFDDRLPNMSYLSDVVFPKQLGYIFNGLGNEQSYESIGINTVYNFKSLLEKPKLQLIYFGINTIEKVVSDFDFSFNQIWFDGSEVKVSNAFLETLDTKKVTLINPKIRDMNSFTIRVDKFQRKFPELNFDLVINSKLEIQKPKKAVLRSKSLTDGLLGGGLVSVTTQTGVHIAPPNPDQWVTFTNNSV
jgi:hypothetical protein